MTDPEELRAFGRTWTKYRAKKGSGMSNWEFSALTVLLGMLIGAGIGHMWGYDTATHVIAHDLIERGVCVWTVDPVSGEKQLAAKCGEVTP